MMREALALILMVMTPILLVHILFMRPYWKGSVIGTLCMLVLNYAIYHKEYLEIGSVPMMAAIIAMVMGIIGMIAGSIFQWQLFREDKSSSSQTQDNN